MSSSRPTLRQCVPQRDVVLLTLDALRYDTALLARQQGRTPTLDALLPDGWERRHSPGTFTYASHQSFFAGFLPTPVDDPAQARPLALRFPGSRTIDRATLVLDGPSVPQGFAARGYRTICIGSTGFFNPLHPLGRVLPALFDESYWRHDLGVTDLRSPRNQVALAVERLAAAADQRVFLFINLGATHPPTRGYLPGAGEESVATQVAALAAIDRALPPLLEALRGRGGAWGIACSDHGTCFGDDGLYGHRLVHPVVLTVPYGEWVVEPADGSAASLADDIAGPASPLPGDRETEP